MRSAILSALGDLWRAVRRPEAHGVAWVLMALTAIVAFAVGQRSRELDQVRVEREASLLATLLKQRFDSHRDGLFLLKQALERADRRDWLAFSNHVDLLYPSLHYPALSAFGFAPKIVGDRADLFATWAATHAHRPLQFRAPPEGVGDWISFPVGFYQPIFRQGSPPPPPFEGWGLDLNHDPEERDRMRWAWGHGARLSTTHAGGSVLGPGTPSQVRLYLPILAPDELAENWATESNLLVRLKGLEGADAQARTDGTLLWFNFRRLVGVLFGTLDVQELLDVAFPTDAPALAVEVYDSGPGGLRGPMAGRLPARSYLRTTRSDRYYGRDWRLEFGTTPAWEVTSLRWWAWAVMAFGTSVSAVAGVAMGFWALGREQDRTAREVAESRNAELARARDDLRTVQTARQQLQRNLHDAVLQRLYALSLHARRLWRAAERGEAMAPGELGMQVTELDGAMTELRSFLAGNQREDLQAGELGPALRGLTVAFTRQTGVQVTLEADERILATLPPECCDHLLHMVREGMSNAWRHGQARQIVVRLESSDGALCLDVEDNGAGFDPRQPRCGGHGLSNLAERAKLCGGVLEVDSRPGGPTHLRVTVGGKHEA